MNKSYLNYTIFLAIVVIFCLAAYLYINHANTQFKEHFEQITVDQVTLNQDEYDLNTSEIEESYPEFNCAAHSEQEECVNIDLCKYDNDTSECLNSDAFIFKIIKVNLDSNTSTKISLPSIGIPVYRDSTDRPKIIIAELINAQPSINPRNDMQITYDNEDEKSEKINVDVPAQCLSITGGCPGIGGQSVHLVVKALFRKDVNDNTPTNDSPTSPAVFNCNIDNADIDTVSNCIENECNIEYDTTDYRNVYKCRDNTVTETTNDVLVIKIDLDTTESKNVTLDNYESNTKNIIANLFIDYIKSEPGLPISLQNLISETKPPHLKLFPINTTDNIDYKNISFTYTNNELNIKNNGDKIGLYLLLMPYENAFMDTPAAETSTACLQYGVSQKCVNQICLEQTKGYYAMSGKFQEHGAACDLELACTNDNIQRKCPNEWTNPSQSSQSTYTPNTTPSTYTPITTPYTYTPITTPSTYTPITTPSTYTPTGTGQGAVSGDGAGAGAGQGDDDGDVTGVGGTLISAAPFHTLP